MFKLFRRRREKHSVMFSVFEKMAAAVEEKQRRAAEYLNTRVSVFSARQLKVGLCVFCLVFGCASFYLIWKAFNQPAATVRVNPITIPDYAIIPETEVNNLQEGMLTESEISNIRAFQHYLDSLQQSTKGRATYDSIARHRSGLLDSLAFIERVYSEQLKTSEDGKKK